jgi:hypothetical protein
MIGGDEKDWNDSPRIDQKAWQYGNAEITHITHLSVYDNHQTKDFQ